MSASDRATLWDRLDAAGVVEGAAPSAAVEAVPGYVRAMVGIAGWIAACFLLAFIGGAVAFAFRTGGASVTVGLVLCAAAIALLWSFAAREFVAQFALALSLAGQAMVVVGLFALFPRQDRVVYAIITAFELALALAAPYSIHRTWSALVAAMALLFALITLRVSFLFPALVAAGFVAVELNEARLARHADIWQPVSAGLALSLLLLVPATLAFSLFGELVGTRALHDTATAWRGSALVALVLIVTVAMLLARNGVRLGGRAGVATLAACVALAAAWQVPAIIAAVIVVITAFASGRRALVGLGLVALAATLGHHYFSLDGTLLAKSASLIAAGAVLLAARFAARHWVVTASSEGGHA